MRKLAYRVIFANRLSGDLDTRHCTAEGIAYAITILARENAGVFEHGDSIRVEKVDRLDS